MSVVDTGGEAAFAPSAACDIACVWPGPMRLGECPLWDWRQNRLLWIDSLAGRIWRLGPDDPEPAFWTLPAKIGSIALREKGGLVAALDSGFALIEEDGAEIAVTMIGDPEPDQPGTRLNDGKTDRQGRFWCGSMDSALKAPLGALYRLDADLSWHRMDEGITVSNGIAVSPDGRCLYFSDSRVDRSYRYDLDPWTGAAANRRPFVDTTRFEGRIDGATVDAAGNYWGALFDGAAVGCFSPEGEMLSHIPLPVRCPTMCSFGGPDLDTLYVTTATFMMSDDEIAAEPLAGSLLSVSGLGVRGLPETAFAG